MIPSPISWSVLKAAVLTACLAASELAAQARPTVVAILPFQDRGSYGQQKEVFRALQLGIPATIANELRGHAELRVADPNRVAQALRAVHPEPNAKVDAATAARVGQEVGARYAVTGNFSDFYGRFRLDARIIDTESGQIVKVVSNDDPELQDRKNLYRIIEMVGHKVLAEATAAGRAGRVRMAGAEERTIPTEALTDYSLGLLYESQGDKSKAVQHYDRALTAFPEYSEARERSRRMRGP